MTSPKYDPELINDLDKLRGSIEVAIQDKDYALAEALQEEAETLFHLIYHIPLTKQNVILGT